MLGRSLIALAVSAISLCSADNTASWKSRSIYFAFTDRFARYYGDSGGSPCGNLGNYCGGTFKGLESKLDYIQGMGFDAIWITPPVAQTDGGYHGYWAQDIYSINSHLGSAQDLKDLITSAHGRGMYVMADVAPNHVGPGGIGNRNPWPLNQNWAYHSQCTIDYNNQWSIENCWLSNLPDVNTQDSNVRTMYQNWIKWLVSNFGFDGLRIDTAKHIEKDFWPPFISAAGVYAFGEAWKADAYYLGDYTKVLPGVVNFAVYDPMRSFYQNKGASASDITAQLDATKGAFVDPTTATNMLDSHDVDRWLSTNGDAALLKNALSFVILTRGIPTIYYGTEQSFTGTVATSNREDLWRSYYNTNADIYKFIAILNGVRKMLGGLTGNDQNHLLVQSNAYAWSRNGGDLIVVTSNIGSKAASTQLCFNTGRANAKWTDKTGSAGTVSSDSNSKLCVTVTGGMPSVLVASTVVPKTSVSTTGGSTTGGSTTGGSTSGGSTTGGSCPSTVSVTFTHKITTTWGDTVKMPGSIAQLANWNPTSAPALNANSYTSANPVWKITINIPAGQTFQYKFVKVSSSGAVTWEADPNRSYTAPKCAASDSVSN